VRVTGNVLALRSALAKFLDLSRRGLAFFTSYRYTEAENAEIEAAFDEAKTALAAPPRNCDLYPDCNSAWKAYNAIADRERLPGFDYWLFEEAKQEGGAPRERHGYGTPDMAGTGVVNGG
jgi:hypothetical protein